MPESEAIWITLPGSGNPWSLAAASRGRKAAVVKYGDAQWVEHSSVLTSATSTKVFNEPVFPGYVLKHGLTDLLCGLRLWATDVGTPAEDAMVVDQDIDELL